MFIARFAIGRLAIASFAFAGLLGQNVAAISFVTSERTGTCSFDAFCSTAMSFHFRHNTFLLMAVWLLLPGSEENHGYGVAFLCGIFFDIGVFTKNNFHSFDDFIANFDMGAFSAPEGNGNLYLVTLIKKFLDVVAFGLKIAFISFRANFDFFQLDDFLLFLGFFGFFSKFILVLTKVHESANGRIRRWGYFYQVKAPLFSHYNGVAGVYDTDHAAVFIDQANLRNPNPSVDAYSTFDTHTSGKIKMEQQDATP